MIGNYEYSRRYSYFAPPYTYEVRDYDGRWIGEVARMEGMRNWHASNKTWTGGGDLVRAFPTRGDAATALRHLADGTALPEAFGGYVDAR